MQTADVPSDTSPWLGKQLVHKDISYEGNVQPWQGSGADPRGSVQPSSHTQLLGAARGTLSYLGLGP